MQATNDIPVSTLQFAYMYISLRISRYYAFGVGGSRNRVLMLCFRQSFCKCMLRDSTIYEMVAEAFCGLF